MRQSALALRALYEASSHYVGLLDAEGIVLWVNRPALELAGLSTDQVLGLPFHHTPWWRHSAELRERLRLAIGQAASGETARFESVNPNAAGENRTIDITLKPLLNETDRVIGIIAEGRDVTDIRRTQAALQEERSLLETMLGTASALIVTLDPSGRIERFNAECERVTGYKAVDAVGQLFWDFLIPPEERSHVAEGFQQLVAGAHSHSSKNVWLTRDRRRRLIDWRNSCLRHPDGTLRCVVSIGVDMTEQRRVERALRESEEKFSKAFRASADPLAISRFPSGRFVDANEAYCQLVGHSLASLVGRNAVELNLWERLEERTQYIDTLGQCGGVRDLVTRLRRASGELILCRINSQLIEAGGGRFIFSRVDDITRQEAAARALRESEEKFARVFHAAVDPMSIAEFPSGRLSAVNEAFCRLFEFSKEEMLGRTGKELGLWRNLPDRDRYFDLLANDGAVHELEATTVTRSGRHIIVRASAHMIELGGRRSIVTRLRDITEQRAAETALVKSEERFSKAFRSSPDAISISEMEDGRLIDVNAGFLELSGYAREEVIGRTSIELNFWTDVAKRGELVERLQREGSVRDVELPFRTKDGTLRLCWLAAEVAEIGGHPCLITIIRDLTRRRQAEAALRESEERYRIVAEQTGQIVYDYDIPSGRINWAGAVVRLTGFTPAEMQSMEVRRWEALIHPEDRVAVSEALAIALATRQPFHARYRFQRKDGTYWTVEDNGAFLCDGCNEPHRLLGTMSDVTDRQRLEEQLRHAQKMESVGLLAGGVAHDFNNILTVIQGNTSLVLGDPGLPAGLSASLREVQHAAEFAARLTRQLLVFSRQQVYQPGRASLDEIVARMARLLQRAIGEHIALTVTPGPAEMPEIHADSGMVEQVLLNLAVNARDAMPTGGRLTIATLLVEVDGRYVHRVPQARIGRFAGLRVRDTGTGIAPEVLPRIFDPFFTTKAEGRGTGLGLATVYGIAQQHGGWIEVDSQVGAGTEFTVWFPTIAGSARSVATPSPKTTLGPGTETILLVEDKKAVRDVLKIVFRRCGYQVLPAESGSEALELWRQHHGKIALLFTDVVMAGGMNGRELVEQIRAESPELKVIYCSGYGADIIGTDALAMPGTRFMNKPFDITVVSRVVRELLDE